MINKLSQTALYGEVLTDEQRYSFEISDIPKLTEEQRMDIWEQLRQGDFSGKERLLLSFLRYVKTVATTLYKAYSWSSPRFEYLDIVQTGHLALLEHFEAALEKPNPTAYILACAKFEMYKYCRRYQHLIVTPDNEEALFLVSLDCPVCSETGESELFADIIPDPSAGDLGATIPPQFDGLDQALILLNPNQREVVERYYGLNEHAPEPLGAIGKPDVVCHTKQGALRKLRALLQTPKNACEKSGCEVYSLDQVCQRLGVSKKNFTDNIAYKNGISSVYMGHYRKEDIERIALQREQRKTRRIQHASCQTEIAVA